MQDKPNDVAERMLQALEDRIEQKGELLGDDDLSERDLVINYRVFLALQSVYLEQLAILKSP
jgi:hypothetical protein